MRSFSQGGGDGVSLRGAVRGRGRCATREGVAGGGGGPGCLGGGRWAVWPRVSAWGL